MVGVSLLAGAGLGARVGAALGARLAGVGRARRRDGRADLGCEEEECGARLLRQPRLLLRLEPPRGARRVGLVLPPLLRRLMWLQMWLQM